MNLSIKIQNCKKFMKQSNLILIMNSILLLKQEIYINLLIKKWISIQLLINLSWVNVSSRAPQGWL